MKAGQTVLLRLMLAAMLPFLAPLSAQEAPAVTSHQKAARDLYPMVGGANTAEAMKTRHPERFQDKNP